MMGAIVVGKPVLVLVLVLFGVLTMKRPLPPVRWSRCQKAYGTRFSFATLRGHTRSSQSQSTVTKTSLVFFDRQFVK
jgi:predicted ATPase